MRYAARTFLSAVPFWIAVAVLLAPPTHAQTVKCGDVCSETWTAAGNPYIVTCDVRVYNAAINCTLTIEAGTEVRFDNDTQLLIHVEDNLVVNGTSGSPVTFTSNSGTPASWDWLGIRMSTDASATLDYANVLYTRVGIGASGGSLTVSGGTFEHNGISAINVSGMTTSITGVTFQNNDNGLVGSGGGTLDVTDSTFTQNNIGIYIGGGNAPAPAFTMRNSSIYGNNNWGLYSSYIADADNTILDIRQNWWGSTDTTEIRSDIHDHANSEPNAALADWCEYLDGPGGTPVTTYECPDLLVCDETDIWNVTSRPYLLATEVIVCPTGRLEVGPGVEVRAARHSELNILVNAGQVDIDATSGTAAIFTTDDSSPGPGYWKGFRVYRTIDVTPTLDIKNASITYAQHGIEAYDDAVVTLDSVDISNNSASGMIFSEDASVSLTSVTSQQNGQYALRVLDFVTLSATGCTFINNGWGGVSVEWYAAGSGSFAINNSSIHTNGGSEDVDTFNATNPGETVLDFKNNWWNTVETATIMARISDHVDNASRPIVDWCPFLDSAPPAGAALDVECPDLSICGGTVRWDVTARPYLLVSDVYVCPAMTLEIGPGVEVRSIYHPSGIEIRVEGILDVQGTEAAPVTFISDRSTPDRWDWQGITGQASGGVGVESATVQHARNGLWAKDDSVMHLTDVAVTDCGPTGVYVENNAVAFMKNVVASGNDQGLYIEDNAEIQALGCTFTGNQGYGVGLYGTASYNPNVLIRGSIIHSNLGAYDFHANQVASQDSWIVWAPDCWWGTEDESQIASRIYDNEENSTSPRVYFRPYGPDCEPVIGRDDDGDGAGDFEDNCPIDVNVDQTDADADGMGDLCDPYPGAIPTGDCDGLADDLDGFADADSDGWGDPCDHQPTRVDSYPGATELCDARDNDDNLHTWELDEYGDDDFDGNIDCYDCDTFDPVINSCNCEDCSNIFDDDCDLLIDGDDPDCEVRTICIEWVTETIPDMIFFSQGGCSPSADDIIWELIRGDLGQVGFSDGWVDLGRVVCVGDVNGIDSIEDTSADPNPACDDAPVVFYVGKDTYSPDYGVASTGERRAMYSPSPACP
jgi:hypothetical protein